MPYQVLARKWRPQIFEDVIGQEHITDILSNSLETGRIHHGYLFSGIRGIGKTTTARILAKALNCVHGPTSNPCNRCEFCKEITEGYSMDVEEIDGASNRGVDEIRTLQENTAYAPSRSRYKIFLIDEVHMLTAQAFNALLKTLEEPPPNVVFIMATTEPWKIPMTILSRCQQFKFKQSSSLQLINLLRKLAQHEQIMISENSLALLAKIADGSVRDAENLFDQVIGFCGDSVGDDDVRYVLGIPGNELLHEFLTAFFTHQPAGIFSLMEQLVNQGYNLRFFCMELMERIRNLIVLKIANRPECYLRLFDYTRTDLERYALQTTLSELQQLYWLIAEAERAIKFSPNPRFILEMALSNMANVQELKSLNDLSAQLQEISTSIEPEIPGELGKEQMKELRVMWQEVLDIVQQKRPALAAILKNAIPVQLTQDEFTIGFHQEAEFSKKSFEDGQNISFLSDILKAYLGRTVRIVPTIHNEAVSIEIMRKTLDQRIDALPRPEAGPSEYKKPPPSDRRSRAKGNWHKRSSSGAYKPPVQVSVQDLVKLFEGRIEEDV